MKLNKISPEHSPFIGHYKQKHVKRLHLKVGLKRTVYKTVTKQSLPSALLISVLSFPMWVMYFIPITRRRVISLFYFLSHSYTECIKWIKYLLYFIINIKKICLSISFPIIIWIQWLHTFKSDPALDHIHCPPWTLASKQPCRTEAMVFVSFLAIQHSLSGSLAYASHSTSEGHGTITASLFSLSQIALGPGQFCEPAFH